MASKVALKLTINFTAEGVSSVFDSKVVKLIATHKFGKEVTLGSYGISEGAIEIRDFPGLLAESEVDESELRSLEVVLEGSNKFVRTDHTFVRRELEGYKEAVVTMELTLKK